MKNEIHEIISSILPQEKDIENFEIPSGENIGEYHFTESLRREGFNAALQDIRSKFESFDFSDWVWVSEVRAAVEKHWKLMADLHSGWTGEQSGECCEKCRMIDTSNPLQALVGCKNPFQIGEGCCHLPRRKIIQGKIDQRMREILSILASLSPHDTEAKP